MRPSSTCSRARPRSGPSTAPTVSRERWNPKARPRAPAEARREPEAAAPSVKQQRQRDREAGERRHEAHGDAPDGLVREVGARDDRQPHRRDRDDERRDRERASPRAEGRHGLVVPTQGLAQRGRQGLFLGVARRRQGGERLVGGDHGAAAVAGRDVGLERSVEGQGNPKTPARTAGVRVAGGGVQLQVPHVKRGEHGREPLSAWVIHVKEIDAPAGEEPLEWILLTNVPTATAGEASERTTRTATDGWRALLRPTSRVAARCRWYGLPFRTK